MKAYVRWPTMIIDKSSMFIANIIDREASSHCSVFLSVSRNKRAYPANNGNIIHERRSNSNITDVLLQTDFLALVWYCVNIHESPTPLLVTNEENIAYDGQKQKRYRVEE